MLLSALGFALMAACVKIAALRGIPLLEIVAARALVSLLLSYADVRRKGISPWGEMRGLLLARGLIGALALICVYYAVTTLPLTEATLLQYLHPVFAALLAWLFLSERVDNSTLICLGLSISGLLVMVNPASMSASSLPMFSVWMGLLGAFGSAIAYLLVRKLSQREDASVIILYFPLVALPVSLLLLGDDAVLPNATSAFLLLLVGIFTQLGQWGLTHALRVETTAKASAYAYIQVVFAALLGALLFDDLPTLWTCAGGALIVAGAVVNVWRR